MAGERFFGLVGSSAPMRELYRRCTRVAREDGLVGIVGETGVGKTRIARLLHARSPRRNRPWARLPAVGVEPGGLALEWAAAAPEVEDGTLLVDEVGDLAPADAEILLQLLDRPDAPRGLVTTHGSFSEPLADRLKDRILRIPPLRERLEDLPLLVVHFLCRFTRRYRKDLYFPDDPVLESLAALPWPGNVRELANEIEQAVILAPAGSTLGAASFSCLQDPSPRDVFGEAVMLS